LDFYIIRTTLNGLETSLSALFISASLLCYLNLKEEPDNLQKQIILGVVLGLAVFARIDNIILIASILIYDIYSHLRERAAKDLIRKIIILIIVSVVVYSPWLIYSYLYTSDLYPVSGKAIKLLSLVSVDDNPTFDNWYSIIT
jgi:4-amino-4-deoxy-L-arabinose transferase-like glycosyltransferase